jgi:hypothetical protein
MSDQYMKATISNAGLENLKAARKSAWMRENERIANPPKEIDWTATMETGKTVFKKSK